MRAIILVTAIFCFLSCGVFKETQKESVQTQNEQLKLWDNKLIIDSTVTVSSLSNVVDKQIYSQIGLSNMSVKNHILHNRYLSADQLTIDEFGNINASGNVLYTSNLVDSTHSRTNSNEVRNHEVLHSSELAQDSLRSIQSTKSDIKIGYKKAVEQNKSSSSKPISSFLWILIAAGVTVVVIIFIKKRFRNA